MKWGKLGRLAVALAAGGGFGIAAVVGSATSASADYGASSGIQATYQVEVSANIHDLVGNGTGGGIWFWAALTPSSPGANHGTAAYQETDCVHHVPPAPNEAVHNAGSANWTDSGGVLTIEGVATALGPVDVTVPDTYGHYVFPTNVAPVFSMPPFSLLPAQVQVAP